MSETRARSGRQARQAERAQKGAGVGRPYIQRNIPTYDVLSEENLVKVERAADRILAETGIEFRDDPEALTLWRAAGADVQGTLVKFPPGLLRELVWVPIASQASSTHTSRPVWAIARATAKPTTPAPTTTQSTCSIVSGARGWSGARQVGLRFVGIHTECQGGGGLTMKPKGVALDFIDHDKLHGEHRTIAAAHVHGTTGDAGKPERAGTPGDAARAGKAHVARAVRPQTHHALQALPSGLHQCRPWGCDQAPANVLQRGASGEPHRHPEGGEHSAHAHQLWPRGKLHRHSFSPANEEPLYYLSDAVRL